jgi:hypothetical protein
MRTAWTRELIIRHILDCEAQGRPLTIGGKGIDHLLYSASRRIFGSWRNALLAAGILPERILTWERWSPAKVLAQIRVLSRRCRPLTTSQMERRYCNLVSAARRHFGSWSKAILAAGVDPLTLQRIVPWNQERVIAAILTRALRGESLVARLIEPRSLTKAAYRFFGSWHAAVSMAGLDPKLTEMPSRRKKSDDQAAALSEDPRGRVPAYRVWNRERVIECIQERVRENKPVNAYAVTRECPKLYAAANRHLDSWDDAIRAAGLDPNACRRKRPPSPQARHSAVSQSQGEGALRLDEGA